MLVKVPEGCTNTFDIKSGDRYIGTGKAGVKTIVGPGTRDIELKLGDGGGSLTINGVLIKVGEATIVDFSDKIGVLVATPYPKLDRQPRRPGYLVYRNNTAVYFGSRTFGQQVCLRPDTYRLTRYGLLTPEEAVQVTIRAGETTVVSLDQWPTPLGLTSFASKERNTPRFRVVNTATKTDIYTPSAGCCSE